LTAPQVRPCVRPDDRASASHGTGAVRAAPQRPDNAAPAPGVRASAGVRSPAEPHAQLSPPEPGAGQQTTGIPGSVTPGARRGEVGELVML